MKTVTEIQLILTNQENEKLQEALSILNTITSICGKPFDKVTFRCWDIDHDYVEYRYEQLAYLTRLMNNIVTAAEVGFNHIEKGQNDD